MCPSSGCFIQIFHERVKYLQILSSLAFKRGDHKHTDRDIFLYICQFVEWDDLFRTDTERCSEK